MKEAVVYAARCAEGREQETAYQLLALALQHIKGWDSLPTMERSENGKPYFPAHPAVQFSISHSRGAAVAVLHNRPVGVDVEKLRPAPRRLAQGEDALTFFHRWTALEACVKRAGGRILTAWRENDISHGNYHTNETLLHGWVVTVCTTENCPVRWVCVEDFGGTFPVDKN